MIQSLDADCIWLDEGASIELQHHIRRDLCVTRAAAKAAFLICAEYRASRKNIGKAKEGNPCTKCTSGAAHGRYMTRDSLNVPRSLLGRTPLLVGGMSRA